MNDFDLIKSIVDKGISMMKNDLSEQELSVWIDYARSMLKITHTPKMQAVERGFLQVLVSINTQSLLPYQKLNTYIKFFLETLK